MLDFGRGVTFKHDKILTSARYVQCEVLQYRHEQNMLL